MDEHDLAKILKYGNDIGNHSHSHSYNLHSKSFKEQYSDYKKNNDYLENISNKKIDFCAFPFGKYNNSTLSVMNKLKFKNYFAANHIDENNDPKILKRYDHSLLISNNNIDLSLLK